MKWKPSKFTTPETSWRGIFVTCNRGREKQCASEVQQWFETVVDEYFDDEPAADEKDSLEADIAKEVAQLTSKRKKVVVHVNLGVECVVFAQLRHPLDPVQVTLKICELAQQGERATKYIQRLGPVQQFVKIDDELTELKALEPLIKKRMHDGSKFAIRPTLRLTAVTRDRVIPAIARLVGTGHKVSLDSFEELVLVEGFKSVIGVAVLNTPAEKVKELCRFNVAQIVAGAAS